MALGAVAKIAELESNSATSHRSAYSDMEFTQRIGPLLNELRSKQLLCDTIIEVETKEFHVHRCVLAATSPYFRSMFTEEWSEGKESTIRLAETKHCGFEEVVRFAYTGDAELNDRNLKDVLISANFYCYPGLSELCAEYMRETIDEHNCLYYRRLAEMYEAHSVLTKADYIVLNNFSTIIKNTEFLDVSKEALCRFIISDELRQNTQEIDIFQAVCAWMTHQQERSKLAPEIMKSIQFNLLSTEELEEYVLQNELVRQDKFCVDMVLKSLLLCRKACAGQTVASHIHTEQNNMFVLDESGKIMAGKITDQSTFAFQALSTPPNKVSNYNGITCGNLLYLVLNKYDLGPNTPSLLQHNLTANRWQRMSDMKVVKAGHELAVINGQIIVIGGQNQSGMLSSVEQYSIASDTWQEFPSLPFSRTNIAACVYDGSLYISGGSTANGVFHNDLCVQHNDSKGWRGLAPMPTKLGQHAMVNIGSNIYVINGMPQIAPGQAFSPQNQPCQGYLYNPDTNQWSTLTCTSAINIFSPTTATIYKESIYTIRQCNVHSGKCLVRLDHVKSVLKAYCVTTLETGNSQLRFC